MGARSLPAACGLSARRACAQRSLALLADNSIEHLDLPRLMAYGATTYHPLEMNRHHPDDSCGANLARLSKRIKSSPSGVTSGRAFRSEPGAARKQRLLRCRGKCERACSVPAHGRDDAAPVHLGTTELPKGVC